MQFKADMGLGGQRLPANHEELVGFVPQVVARQLAKNPAPLSGPRTERFQAAVLYADINGFTILTDLFAQRGPGGVEELSHLVNDCFGRVIDLCASHGGEVVAFAGDAPIVIWPLSPGQSPSADQEDLWSLGLRATQCAIALQGMFQNFKEWEGYRLSIRIGIGIGEILATSVGGRLGHWEFLVAGDALEQSCLAERHAAPGEVVISPKTVAITQGQCVGNLVAGGFLRVDGLHTNLPLRPTQSVKLPPESEVALRAYLPPAVLSRIDAGQKGWLAELRRVTVVFVNILGLDYADPSATDRIQRVALCLQEILIDHEGFVDQFIADDKGTSLLAAFGLPFQSHEDDAARGIRAALKMCAKLAELGYGSRIGVATGQVFCGERGNPLRKEFALIGDTVNLAARLMEAAKDEVLCDATTYQGAKGRLNFDRLPSATIKGKADPINIYRASERALPVQNFQPMVGRTVERETLLDALEALGLGSGQVILLEGEPGMGKSRLIGDFLEKTKSANVKTLVGSGDSIEKLRPYHGWRGVFSQYFRIGDEADSDALRRQLLARLQADADLLTLAPLLNVVLPLDLLDNEITVQMKGQVRADNTNELLVRLLKNAAEEGPLAIILEDAHWLDSASWTVTRIASLAVHPLLLVVVTRPMPEQVPEGFKELLQVPGIKRIQLGALDEGDVHRLLCQRLGVSHVPQPVVSLIYERAQGNPFYSEELIYGLQDAGLMNNKGDICQLDPNTSIDTSIMPDTVQGVIRSRIDRLTPQQQLALKVGSVIGRVFAHRVLHDIYPILNDKIRLLNYAYDLQRLGFTLIESPEPNLAYLFKHVLTQEVAYSFLLFEQRRHLHSAVAEWYEANQLGTLPRFYPLLGYHWARAEVPEKAVHFLEKAGNQALSGGAYREAVAFLQEALTWEQQQPTHPDPELDRLRKGRLERELGEAYLGLGNHVEGQVHIHRALALFGWPVPKRQIRLVAHLIKQILLQGLHRLWPRKWVGHSHAHGDALIEGARAYIRLVETYWFANETVPLVNAGISALNLAEATGPSPELARAYAIMCLATGSVPLHRLAELYARKAVRVAQKLDQLFPLAYVLFITSVYRIGTGQWDRIQSSLDQATAIFERIGDRRLLGDAMTVFAMSTLYRGEFSQCEKKFSEIHQVGEKNQNSQHQIWGLIGKAECVLRLGHMDEALRLLQYVLSLLQKSPDRAEELRTQGLLAVSYLRGGNYSLAENHAEKAANLIAQFPMPTAHYLLEGYCGAAEVYLALWEISRCQPNGKGRALAKSASKACAALRQYSRVFSIGEPRAWLCRGLAQWQGGQAKPAYRSWARSLSAGKRLGMLYEQGLTHYEIGRHSDKLDANRQDHLTQACSIFSQINADHNRHLAQKALQDKTEEFRWVS